MSLRCHWSVFRLCATFPAWNHYAVPALKRKKRLEQRMVYEEKANLFAALSARHGIAE